MSRLLKPFYEFSFTKDTFEYVAGNAAFYELRGADCLYDTMANNLLVGDSYDKLKDMIAKEEYNKTFTMHIADHDKQVHFVACRIFRQDSDVIRIRMVEMDRLFEDYNALQMAVCESDALLSQYECVYFSYDCKTDEVTCYTYDMGKTVIGKRPLAEWRDEVNSKIRSESRTLFDDFVGNIRNGTRDIECIVEPKSNAKVALFVGSAIYDEEVHVKTVGRIGDPNMVSAHELTQRDQLTGLFLKETITSYAKHRIDEQRLHTILAIVDIDDFKNVNDNFGHAKGDEVLKKCAAIIESQSEGYGKVGRIGGDEFFIVFDKGHDFDGIKNVLRSIKNSVYAAYTDETDGFHVSTSIGLSVYPDDIEGSYDTMFQLADCLLYRAKRKGKNRWIVYNREKHGAVEDILSNGVQKVGLSGMRGIDKSELVCKITNMMICGTNYPVGSILYDITNYFAIERINLYNKTDKVIETQLGEMLVDCEGCMAAPKYIYNEEYMNMFENGVLVINSTKYFEQRLPEVYEELMSKSTHSLIQYVLNGESGKQYILSFEAVKGIVTWNTSDMSYLRILTKIMERLL